MVGRVLSIINIFLVFLFKWRGILRLKNYLERRPRIRQQLRFETWPPEGSDSSRYTFYDDWPSAWKRRLRDCFLAYYYDEPLPIADSLPLSNDSHVNDDSSRLGYRDEVVARDVYFAWVAHALWLDMSGSVPWRLEEWSDHELSYLLCSKVFFSAYLTLDNNLYYVVYVGSRNEVTENILGDPRDGYRFMSKEPEQENCLIGGTPGETGQKLSEWFHDYLWHNSESNNISTIQQENHTLADRLDRGEEDRYYTSGCASASSLFADLMRSVNIPVRKVNNAYVETNGTEAHHIGLVFNWQGSEGRYLIHTDELFDRTQFFDPAPAPKDTERGVALWDHVWLSPATFGERFSYDSRDDFFGRATTTEIEKYWQIGSWLACSAVAIFNGYSLGNRVNAIESLQQESGLTEAEADECWNHVEASLLSYGDGSMSDGYQELMERHIEWYIRTGKRSVTYNENSSQQY